MARGIEILYDLLQSEDELIQELAANNIASLAHTRAGELDFTSLLGINREFGSARYLVIF